MKKVFRVLLLQGVTYGIQVAFMLAAARVLGPEQQGQYAILRTTAYWAEAFLWLGLTSGIPYFIAKDEKRYHDLVLLICPIYAGLSTACGAAALLMWHAFAAGGSGNLRLNLLVLAWIFSLALVQVLLKVFLGQRRYHEYNLVNLVGSFAMLIAFLLVWRLGRISVGSIIGCGIFGNFLTLLLGVYAHRVPLGRLQWPSEGAIERTRDLYRVGIQGYLSSIAFLVLYRADFFMVGLFLGAKTLGIYSTAVFIIEAIQKVPDWLALIFTPEVAAGMDLTGSRARKYIILSFSFVLLAGIVMLVLYAQHISPARMFLGAKYQGLERVVMLLLPRALLHSIMVIFAAYLSGKGYTFYHPAAGVVATAGLVLFDRVMVPGSGVVGAAQGIMFAYFIATAVMYAGYRKQLEGHLRTAPAP